MQARIDELAEIAEAREDKAESFRVMMIGDSTMEHQFGAVCSFLGEREGRRFDPQVFDPGAAVLDLYWRRVFARARDAPLVQNIMSLQFSNQNPKDSYVLGQSGR